METQFSDNWDDEGATSPDLFRGLKVKSLALLVPAPLAAGRCYVTDAELFEAAQRFGIAA